MVKVLISEVDHEMDEELLEVALEDMKTLCSNGPAIEGSAMVITTRNIH